MFIILMLQISKVKEREVKIIETDWTLLIGLRFVHSPARLTGTWSKPAHLNASLTVQVDITGNKY